MKTTPLLLVALLGCAASDGATDATDRAAYLASIALPPLEADARCGTIIDDGLRNSCRAENAARVATEDLSLASQLCANTDASSAWGDECWFLIADRAGALGEEALRLCSNAGIFAPHCRGHALGRAVEKLDIAVGEEGEALESLPALIAEYRPRPKEKQRERFARALLADVVATRWEANGRFEPTVCGVLSESACTWAFARWLERAGEPLKAFCESDKSPASAAGHGLLTWGEEGAELARQAVSETCARVDDGLLDPARTTEHLPPEPPEPFLQTDVPTDG